MDALETIHVSSRGQIVIPERMRTSMKIKQGAKLVMVQQGARLILQTEEAFLAGLREAAGFRQLSAKSLAKVWENSKDDKVWSKY